MLNYRNVRAGLAALIAVAALAGCAGTRSSLPAGGEAYTVIPPGDVMQPRDYIIGPLDVVSISVFREPDLTIEKALVDSDGNVQVPLLGAVKGAGMTSTQLARNLEARYAERYLKNPSVSVSIVESSRRRVTVDGSVVQPGVYEIPGRISLIDAVALARGVGPTAKTEQVAIIRRVNGQRVGGVFDLGRIRAGSDADPEVIAGDQVIVGTSAIKAFYRDVLFAAPLISVFRGF